MKTKTGFYLKKLKFAADLWRGNSEELMDMFGIKESLDKMAKASSLRWYGHVSRKEDENVIVKALKFEVSGSRGRPKQTWKKQVEIEMKKKKDWREDACVIERNGEAW